jgi:hypothetical protein
MQDLDTLLDRHATDIAALTREIVGWVMGQFPELSGRVMLGWRSVNFRHPRAGFVIAVFPFADHVSIIFQNGRLLSSPLLVGAEIKQVRWIPIKPGETIAWDEIGILLVEAIALRA